MPSSMPIVEEGVDPLENSIDNFVTSVGIEAEQFWARLKQRLPDGRVKGEVKNRPGFEPKRW